MYCVHTGQWSRIRAFSVNITAVISMLNYLLCKSSLASEIAVRDQMYHNEIYLYWWSLPPVLILTNSFGTPCIWRRPIRARQHLRSLAPGMNDSWWLWWPMISEDGGVQENWYPGKLTQPGGLLSSYVLNWRIYHPRNTDTEIKKENHKWSEIPNKFLTIWY